jgi:sigma-E factor negative regulatory protein RseA
MNAENRDNDIKLQLSALLDGELERDQARFLIRRLPDDPELSGCWQRWHVAGDSLRGQGSAPLRADFLARVSVAIADEAVPGRGVSRETLKWIGGFAVAASVALAALMAVRPQAGAPEAAPVSAPSMAQVPQVPLRETDLRVPARAEEAMTVSRDLPSDLLAAPVRIDPRIEGYLVRHNEATQTQGFVSYLPLVTPVRERAPAER